MWDLSKLEITDGSPNDHGDYHAWGLEWNFCRYLDDGESSYFARKLSMTRGAERLTDGDYTPSETVSLKDEEGNYTGVSVTHSSTNFCTRDSYGEDVNYSFTTVVMCDKDITGQGEGVTISSDIDTNECQPSVIMKHDAGCHIYTANWFQRWISRNPWAIGVALLIAGPIIAMTGKRLFPWVAASIGSLATIGAVISLFAESGKITEYWSGALVCLLAIVAGIFAGNLLLRNVKIGFVLIGAVSGAIIGALLFEIVFAIWDLESALGLIITTIVFAIIGGSLTLGRKKKTFGAYVVIFGTSLIGSYLFMRGWTVLFKGWPTESELVAMFNSGEPIDLGGKFFIYIGVLFVTFIFTSFWQWGKDFEKDMHPDLVGDDDDFERLEDPLNKSQEQDV